MSVEKYAEDDAILYAEYARASFCVQERIENWDCGDPCVHASVDLNSPPRFLGPGAWFEVQGYVAILPLGPDAEKGNRCIVSFCGTQDNNIGNILADAFAWRVPWPPGGASWCRDCAVNYGLGRAYAELRPQLLQAIRDLDCRSADVTGHSLGAAVATLASMELRAGSRLHVGAVWTFGKPRFTNRAFVQAYVAAANAQGVHPPMWRVVHHYDLIPRLGFYSFGWIHEPLEVYYTEENSRVFRVCPSTPGDFDENKTCMFKIPIFECSMEDHTAYFQPRFPGPAFAFEGTLFSTECIPPEAQLSVLHLWPLFFAGCILLLCSSMTFYLCGCCRKCTGTNQGDYIEHCEITSEEASQSSDIDD